MALLFYGTNKNKKNDAKAFYSFYTKSSYLAMQIIMKVLSFSEESNGY